MEFPTPATGGASSEEMPTGRAQPPLGSDRHAGIYPKMHVVTQTGAAIGEIDALQHDAVTGDLDAFVVRHGVFGQRHTTLRADQIAQCAGDTVMLTLSYDDFKAMPTSEGR